MTAIQETIFHWCFDSIGQKLELLQLEYGTLINVSIEKLLIFRSRQRFRERLVGG